MSAAPVRVGAVMLVTHSCGKRKRPHTSGLVILAVTQMGGITGNWRIRAARCDGTTVEWATDNQGRAWAA